MSADRRSFRRESEEYRRETLVSAALELVAEAGVGAATVRAIADRAGVTPGLIRHYFAGKDELMRAAYRTHVDGMTQAAVARAVAPGLDPVSRLAAFVVATLTPPVATAPALRRWAGLLHEAVAEEALRETHRDGYLAYRHALEDLIAALPLAAGAPARDAGRLRAEGIACNALLDGLWLEVSIAPELFTPGEVVRVGLESVGALLGVDLLDTAEGAGE